jgi:hypothetical protein
MAQILKNDPSLSLEVRKWSRASRDDVPSCNRKALDITWPKGSCRFHRDEPLHRVIEVSAITTLNFLYTTGLHVELRESVIFPCPRAFSTDATYSSWAVLPQADEYLHELYVNENGVSFTQLLISLFTKLF